MSLLISLLTDLDQKAEVNECIDNTSRRRDMMYGKRKVGDKYKFLADDHQTPAKRLDPSMLLATFYYKSVDPLYFLQQDVSRNLMQDGDPESFAMLLSMQLPDEALSALPSWGFCDAGDFDLVVRDITGQEDAFRLLDYALNLSPALRDTITRDVAQNVSTFEPRLPRSFLGKIKSDPHDASLREGSVQPKAAYLLQPPKAPQE